MLVTFKADAPASEMHGQVITEPGDSRDGIERSVFLPGGTDVDEG